MNKFEFTVSFESESFKITLEAKDESNALSVAKVLFPKATVTAYRPNHIECLNELKHVSSQFKDAIDECKMCEFVLCDKCNAKDVCKKLKSLEESIVEYMGY